VLEGLQLGLRWIRAGTTRPGDAASDQSGSGREAVDPALETDNAGTGPSRQATERAAASRGSTAAAPLYFLISPPRPYRGLSPPPTAGSSARVGQSPPEPKHPRTERVGETTTLEPPSMLRALEQPPALASLSGEQNTTANQPVDQSSTRNLAGEAGSTPVSAGLSACRSKAQTSSSLLRVA
jgi:hypothetical protein